MWQLFLKGGWVMWPILLCSIFSLAIILERALFFGRLHFKFNIPLLKARILEKVRQRDIAAAIKLCEKNAFYLTNILKTGLLRYGESKEIVKEAMEDASLYEIPKLERNLYFLSTLAHISPLLGLLGTVTGLVRCFQIIEQKSVQASGAVNPSDLAGGIWEALLTTVVGLSVAIPSYVAYNYFVHRVNVAVLETERAATELLELVK